MKPKNWTSDTITSRPISTVVTEPAEGEVSVYEQDSFYTKRMRRYLLAVPIVNHRAQLRFQRIVRKTIAILRLAYVSREIKTIGLHSILITRGQIYRKRLYSLMTKVYTDKSAVDSGDVGKCLIDPSKAWKVIWDAFISILLVFCLLYIPYRISFLSEEPTDDAHLGLESSIDICFLIDILLTLNTIVIENHVRITTRKAIFMCYLRGFLVIDIASIFPFSIVTSANENGGSNKLIRLLRLGRLVRIFGSKTIKKWVKGVLKSEGGSGRQAPVVLIACVFIVLIAGHITACFWHFMAIIWNGPDNWVVTFGLADSSAETRYFRCLYWTIVIFATIGYGDITPTNNYERALCIFWLIAGTLLFSTIVGTVISSLTASDARKQIVSEKLADMETLAADLQLSYELKKHILELVERETEAQALSSSQREEIMSMLSPDLREVVYEKSYKGAFTTLKFISNLPQTVIYRLFSMVSYLFKESGLTLYKIGDFADYVYFLNKGRLGYVICGYCFRQILPGILIGEIEVLEGSMRQFTCIAETDCELLVIRDQEFLSFLQDFPAYREQIRELARRRKNNNSRAMNETLELMSIADHRKMTLKDLAGKPRKDVALVQEEEGKDVVQGKKNTKKSYKDEFVQLWIELDHVRHNLDVLFTQEIKQQYKTITSLVRQRKETSVNEQEVVASYI